LISGGELMPDIEFKLDIPDIFIPLEPVMPDALLTLLSRDSAI